MLDDIIKTKWSESHGAADKFLGAGVLYYALVYGLGAQQCVCLGSGGGFVPKIMIAAQRQLVADGWKGKPSVTLVDADVGPWGRPVYGSDGIPGWPEIRLVKQLTSEAAAQFSQINYLHVDADHSYDGVMADLEAYGSRMNDHSWAITVHDTCNSLAPQPIGAWKASQQWALANKHDMVTFGWGAGVSLIMPRKGSS